MFKDFKIDMTAIVAMQVLALFAFVVVYSLIHDGKVTDALTQTLVSMAMIGVGYYLGSSSDSRKKTDAMLQPPPAGP